MSAFVTIETTELQSIIASSVKMGVQQALTDLGITKPIDKVNEILNKDFLSFKNIADTRIFGTNSKVTVASYVKKYNIPTIIAEDGRTKCISRNDVAKIQKLLQKK